MKQLFNMKYIYQKILGIFFILSDFVFDIPKVESAFHPKIFGYFERDKFHPVRNMFYYFKVILVAP